jgi:putative ABC transport system permease protein
MNDLRIAFRQLVKRPGFTLVAIVTLALGIGATTTIFSVVDHLMLRDLPFPDADRVVTLWQANHREGNPREDVAPGNFLEWKDRAGSFAAMGAAEPYSFDLTGEDRPQVVLANYVTDGFFDALGVQPAAGRLLQAEDFRAGSGAVAVVGWGLWQRRFGADPALVGRTIVLDGQPTTVVGILPRDLDLGLGYSYARRDLWVPRRLQGWERSSRSSAWWTVVARLAPGATLATAQADMDRVAGGLAAEFPATNNGVGASVVPLHEHLVGAARPTLMLLAAGVGLVLLVACVNIANLLLARGADRAREIAVRAAMGAGRGRLVVQLLAESAVLAAAGAVAGIVLAFWAVDLIKAVAPGDIPRFETVAVNLRVLGFGVGLAALTALVFGLAPALRLSRPDVREVLAEGRVTPGRGRLRARQALIVAETALALTLLIGAGLLLRSFGTLLRVDPGFHREHLLALQVFYWEDGHTPQHRADFFDRTLQNIRALPGVRSAGAVSAAPFLAANLDIRRAFRQVDEPPPRPGEEPQTYITTATPGYFETMGIPLLRGRLFDERDRFGAPPVVLINETLRRQSFADRDPVGRRVTVGETLTRDSGAPAPEFEILGVVGDVRHTGLDAAPRPEMFFAQGQTGDGSMTYFVRAAGDPTTLIPAVQQVIWAEAPLQTFYQTGSVDALVGATLTGRRFTLLLIAIFAGLALLMAAVGIYGVISFAVTQRTHEVGIRMALGADRRAVLRMILRDGVGLAVVGVAIGLLGAALATPLMGDLLFAVSPRDALAFGAGVVTLLAAAGLASWLPAYRATRISPVEALRHE